VARMPRNLTLSLILSVTLVTWADSHRLVASCGNCQPEQIALDLAQDFLDAAEAAWLIAEQELADCTMDCADEEVAAAVAEIAKDAAEAARDLAQQDLDDCQMMGGGGPPTESSPGVSVLTRSTVSHDIH